MTAIIPVRSRTEADILYGSRTTTHRYELYTHDPATGTDRLIGELDGVQDGGSLTWSAESRVKKSGAVKVLDLVQAEAGKLRFGDVDRVLTRIRPVRVIDGLPDTPLGMYVITAAPESWSAGHRVFSVELHDKSTILDQDKTPVTWQVPAGTVILQAVKTVIASAGESIDIDPTDTRVTATDRSWKAGTAKLDIVNDLLDSLQYNALWVDGQGNFRATPYVAPKDRPIRYDVLNLDRELIDGDTAVYLPDWTRDRDVYGVPNRVVVQATGGGDTEPLQGVATNETTDTKSPLWEFSHARLGFWRDADPIQVEVPDFSDQPDPTAATIAYLTAKAQQSLIAASGVQAKATLKALPLPVELLDATRFQSTPAGIDARHTIQRVELDLSAGGLMGLDLMEVISL